MPPLPQPTDQSIAERHELAALHELIIRLEAHIAPPGAGNDAWYDWLSLPLTTYFQGMRAVRAYCGPGRHRYLEVGSGIGTKLALAHALGYHATGIEHHAAYVDVSRRLVPHCPVIEGDATHQHGAYSSADIIYNYSIAIDPQRHQQVNEHIVANMRSGALYFTARRPFPDHLTPIADNVWTKP